MRNKKLLSTVMAASLAATTMVMPAMAADGSLTADVGVRTTVLRVQVPTAIVVEIDQYETAEAGTQIYSTEFDMTNYSNIPVKVEVESKATAGGNAVNNLVAKKGDVEKASGDAVWLAVAAKTALSGDAQYGASINDLKETNANVTTFGTASGDAKQTFYLEKATGEPSYYAITSAGAANAKAHTKYYQLGGKMVSSGDVVEALKTKDVYVVSGDVATKISMNQSASAGDLTGKYTDGQDAYVVSGDTKNTSQMKEYTGSDTYLWGEVATAAADDKGEASFRYIGKVSKNKAWGTDDIGKITIDYTITGETPEGYAEAAKGCVQGLYQASAAEPAISLTADGVVTLTNLDGTLFDTMAITDGTNSYPVTKNGSASDNGGTWNWADDNVGTLKTFTFDNTWGGMTVTVTVTLTDGTELTSDSVTLS